MVDVENYNIEIDFDNEEIEQLLADGVIMPRDIPCSKASDLLIDGVLDYDQYPFENLPPYEQIRQLEHDVISVDDFNRLAVMEDFDEEELQYLQEVKTQIEFAKQEVGHGNCFHSSQ